MIPVDVTAVVVGGIRAASPRDQEDRQPRPSDLNPETKEIRHWVAEAKLDSICGYNPSEPF